MHLRAVLYLKQIFLDCYLVRVFSNLSIFSVMVYCVGGTIKRAVFAIAGAFIAFLILCVFFSQKAYYPYSIYIESDSNSLPFVNIALLDQKIKNPFLDGRGGTYYIDSAEKRDKGKLLFRGRYYSTAPAEISESRRFLKDAIGTEVAVYLAESVCSSGLAIGQMEIHKQLEELNKKTFTCLDRLGTQLKKDFEFSKFEMQEEGRIKKIIFICAVISLFFGGAVFVALEAWRILKND
jgi:hypothetical protein